MSSMEKRLEDGCKARDYPGLVLLAGDKTGDFKYGKAFGSKSLAKPVTPLALDATFWLASCTKLLTSIAALQCVENGQLVLDDDVSSILPEFKNLEILIGFDEHETPLLKKAVEKVTLRQLLTHTSGLEYDAMNPLTTRWRISRGETVNMDSTGMPMMDRISVPLKFEPGTSWAYGNSTDWVGVMVARATGTDLQSYMQTHLWQPLGIKDLTFHLEQRPDIRERLASANLREGGMSPFGNAADPDGKLSFGGDQFPFADPTEAEWGGAGLWGSVTGYLKILKSILANDSALLKPETVDFMFTPQLSPNEQQALMDTLSVPVMNGSMGALPMGTKVNWGLGGLLLEEDLKSGRKKGSMTWAGLSGPIWWIDRETGICGISSTHIMPFADVKVGEIHWLWEQEMYERLGKAKFSKSTK